MGKIISIAADHAGFEYKEQLKELLISKGYSVADYGTFGLDSVDYPDFVHPLAEAVSQGGSELGVLICGSANGVAITANKHAGIRAAIAWEPELASLARQHNNANVLCLPARFIEFTKAQEILSAFLETDFEGGRHQRRVDKMLPHC
ncbi:ribose 5-phosphate isomerase B [Chitinophagales bacterium]|nr:ribose 5-phosphate isomerase B [Chitinophagales bacterium]